LSLLLPHVLPSSLLSSLCPPPSFFLLFFLIIPPPPSSTLFPYTTLFRSRPGRGRRRPRRPSFRRPAPCSARAAPAPLDRPRVGCARARLARRPGRCSSWSCPLLPEWGSWR